MITAALLSLVSWLILGVSFVLPEIEILPSNFSDLLSDVVASAYGWDWIVPISTMFQVMSMAILISLAELGWRAGKYFVALFRGN